MFLSLLVTVSEETLLVNSGWMLLLNIWFSLSLYFRNAYFVFMSFVLVFMMASDYIVELLNPKVENNCQTENFCGYNALVKFPIYREKSV